VDESAQSCAIPSASQRRWAATELQRCDLGTIDVDRYEGNNGNSEGADEEEEALQADDGSTQNVED